MKSYDVDNLLAFGVEICQVFTYICLMQEITATVDRYNNPLAIQSNALIHARYEMTAIQKKILLMLISKIQPDDIDFKPYRIRVKDFLELADLKSTQIYSKLKSATEGLLSKVFYIKKPTGVLQITIISSAEYFEGRGLMELCFDPKLKPYLLQLKEQFTIMPLKQVLSLRSVYSIRIYEMLQQFKSTGFFITKVDDLKYKLGLENKYKSYNLFKRNVILQAQKELSNTDMAFTFEEIKQSRRIDKIKFRLIPVKEYKLSDEQRQLKEKLMQEFGLTDTQAKKIVVKVDQRDIFKTIFDIKTTQREGRVRTNVAAYAVGVFAAKFNI